jgi:hypothetical protein
MKRSVLVLTIFLFHFVCFAQEQESVTAPSANQTQHLAATAALPESASRLPLFGILAVGFLCAGYMTLRAE